MPTAPGQVRLDDLLGVCSSDGRLNGHLLREMLLLFIEDNARRVQNALRAAAAGDEHALRDEVHAVKGSAALIGADNLRCLAEAVELRLIAGTLRDAEASARQLNDEFDAVVATLKTRYPDLCAE